MAWPPITQSTPPTDGPDWLYSQSGSNIVEPSSGKKAAGWLINERPGSQFWNWIFQNISYWIYWFYQGWDVLALPTTTYAQVIGVNSILGNPSGAGFTVTLLQSSTVPGCKIFVKNVNFATANLITIAVHAGDNLEGTLNGTMTLAQGESAQLQSDGTGNWYIREQN